jgi:hypothetical protein
VENVTVLPGTDIQKNLTGNEAEKLLIESRNASAWIIEAIKRICGEI